MKSNKIFAAYEEWKETTEGHKVWESARRTYRKYNYDFDHTYNAAEMIFVGFEDWCGKTHKFSSKEVERAKDNIIEDIVAGLT